MALDYMKTVYKQERDVSPRANKTSYGHMSRWMDVTEGPYLPPTISVNHYATANMSPAFGMKRKPWSKAPPKERPPGPVVALSQPDMAKEAAVDGSVPVHLRYSQNNGYDDYHRAFRAISNQWPSASYPTFGPPRLRHGRQGGSWRHVTEVMQAGGSRTMFVDGRTTLNDRYQMEETPGAELILGREGDPPINFDSEEVKRTAWIANYRREKDMEPKIKMMLYGSVDKQKGVEKNNWMIMR
ncbi:uncharacterized protein [Haliotis cracherodii]|uniref:uncharacterized protein n=1 Tax=Haliotis cracherodii TaxID=6455 RepID=UPI0039EA06E7